VKLSMSEIIRREAVDGAVDSMEGLRPRRVGTENYSSVPLTEPDVPASHPAPWIDPSERQRLLG
jgi:hypothetical protein